MSNLDLTDPERDLTKHDRLVNAWRAVGTNASVTTVASLVGASKSYASQVRQAMEDGDLTEAEIDDVTDHGLVEQYRQAASAEGEDGDVDEKSTAASNGDDPTGTPTQQQWTSQPLHLSQHVPPREPTGQQPVPTQQQHPQQSQSQQHQQSPGPIQAEDGSYVPVSELQEIDATLATLEEEAQFEVENVPPQQPQHQSALAKLFVAQKARELIGEVAEEAVSADEV